MSFGGYFGYILSLETIKSTYLLYNLVGIIYAPWVYTERRQSAAPLVFSGSTIRRAVFSTPFLI